MTETLNAASDDFARRVSDRANVLGRYSDNARHTDGDTGRIVEGTVVERDTTGIYGTSVTGHRISIDPEKVIALPLHNSYGEVVGIRIPANADDARTAARWADGQLLGHFTSRVPTSFNADGRRPYSVVEDWDSKPFFVVGKFNDREAEVLLDHGDMGAEPAHLGGPEFGSVIARSPEYEAFLVDRLREHDPFQPEKSPHSERPVILVSQGSGGTDPTLVESIARYLYDETDLRSPVRGVVHPTTRIEPTPRSELIYPEMEARVALGPDGWLTSEYHEY